MSLAEKCTFTMVLLCEMNFVDVLKWFFYDYSFIKDHDNSCRCVTNDVVCELFEKWTKKIVKKEFMIFREKISRIKCENEENLKEK